MICKLLNSTSNWMEIRNAALTTVNKENSNPPDSLWKRRILLSEHSMIRKLRISWKWFDLLWWVQTHFTRHHVGVEWWVQTSRTDRTGIDRTQEGSQSNFINVEGEANAQSIINISRKRLCNCASKKTKEAWIEFLESIKTVEPELYSVCVPNCIYRNGLCPEFKTCGYNKTLQFEHELHKYVEGINNQINDKTNIFTK